MSPPPPAVFTSSLKITPLRSRSSFAKEEKATFFFVTNNNNNNNANDDDDENDENVFDAFSSSLDSGFAVTCSVRVHADDKRRAVRVSYCFDVADPRVRERSKAADFTKVKRNTLKTPRRRRRRRRRRRKKVFLVSEQRVLRPEEEMTTKMTLVEEQTGRKKEETGTMMIKVTVEVPLETLRKILERTPTRVQENVAAVLIELIEEGTRVDVLTVITKHARDTKTGALKRVFVNPFIVPRDDGAR